MPSAANFLDGQDEDLEQRPLSAFTPGQGDPEMEGGFETASGEPMNTLEAYERGDAPYVTGATDDHSNIGKTVWRQVGDRNVKVGVTDYGPGAHGLDIAVEKASWGRNFPFQGQKGGGQSAEAFLDAKDEPQQSKSADEFLGGPSRMPTEREAQTAPHAIPAHSLAQQAYEAFKKGEWKQGLNLVDTLTQQGIRRALNLPITRVPTDEELKEQARVAMAELTEPPPGREFKQPEFIHEYYGDHPDTLLKQGGKALAEMPVDVANFFLSPAGAATPMVGALSKTAQAMIAAGFTVQQVWDALHSDDPVQRIKALIFAAGGAAGVKEGLTRPVESSGEVPGTTTPPTAETKPTAPAASDIQGFKSDLSDLSDRELTILAGDTTQSNETLDKATAELNRRAAARGTSTVTPETQRFEVPKGGEILSPDERSARVKQGKAEAKEAKLSSVNAQTVQAVDRHRQLLGEAAVLAEQVRVLKAHGLDYKTPQERIDAINQMLKEGYNRETVKKIAQKDLHDEVAEIIQEERSPSNGNRTNRPKRESTSVRRTPSVEKPKGKKISQEVTETLPRKRTLKPGQIRGTKAAREARMRDLGLTKIEDEARQTWGDAWDAAAEEEQVDPGSSERVATDISETPRAATGKEHAQLLRNMIAAEESQARAVDSVNEARTESEKQTANERLSAARDRTQVAYDALRKSGSEWGRSGSMMQMVADKYYNLARLQADRRAAKGEPLSAGELAETETVFKRMKNIRDRMTEVNKQRGLDKQFARAVAATVMDMNEAPKGAAGLVEWLEGHADKARARIVERRGRLNIGFDPQALTDEIIIGASHVARGLKDFGEWSKKMIEEFGDRIKPHLQDIYDRSLATVAAAAEHAKELRGLGTAKKRIIGATEKLRAKIEAGDVSRIIRKKLPYDEEYFRLRQEHDRVKRQHDSMVAQAEYKRKPGWQRAAHWFTAFERAMKLTGIRTFGKILSAGFVRIPQLIVEDLAGSTLARLPLELLTGGRGEMIRDKAIFERGIGGGTPKRISSYIRGFGEMKDVLTGKIVTKETLIPGPKYLDIPGRSHAAGKRPTWRSAYDAGRVFFDEHAERMGKDLNDPKVKEEREIAVKAYADRQIFLNDNQFSSGFNLITNWLDSRKGVWQPQAFVAARMMRILMPVVRVATNVPLEAFTHITGLLTGTGKLLQVMKHGLENIKPEEADLIMRHYKKGMVGAALMLTGYVNRNNMGGFYLPGEKRKPGSLHWGDMNFMGVRIPWWLLHSPPFMVMQAAATFGKLLDAKRGAWASTMGALNGLAEELPFVRETALIDSMLGEGWKNSKALGNFTAGMISPMLVQNIAQWTDEKDQHGDPIRRYPRTPLDYVKLAFPGLRQQVPTYPYSSRGSTKSSIPFTRHNQHSGMSVQHF